MKYSLKVDKELQEELNRSLKRNSIILIIIGAIGLVAYIGISIFVENFFVEMLLWIFAGALGIGVGLLILVNKTNKNAANNNLVGEYELFEDFLIVNTTKNGEQVSTMKLYYKDVIKTKETEYYIFLYANKQTAFPIPKNKFTADDLLTIRIWINSSKIKK